MTKINKTDLENISLIKKEFKIKDIINIKIKKGDYEIELSSSNNLSSWIWFIMLLRSFSIFVCF